MSKVESLTRAARTLLVAMLFIACVVITSGCGGGSAGSASPPLVSTQPQTPAPIQGVATPTSVAVVTATNTQ